MVQNSGCKIETHNCNLLPPTQYGAYAARGMRHILLRLIAVHAPIILHTKVHLRHVCLRLIAFSPILHMRVHSWHGENVLQVMCIAWGVAKPSRNTSHWRSI